MTRTKTLRFLTVAASGALLAACAVGPQAPAADLPVAGTGAFVGSALTTVSTAQARDDWWRLYDDPTLDGLIRQAFAENNELEAAFANLRAVRASLSEARVGRFPTTTTSAQAQRSRASAATSSVLEADGKAPEIDTYDVGLSASYEVDLFGRVESTIRAARADARSDAALASFDQTVLTALQETETALSNYANELDRRAALTEARDQAARAANLSRQRFNAGADSFLLVLDAERTQAAADAALAQSDALVTTYQIALFRALAGGWQAED